MAPQRRPASSSSVGRGPFSASHSATAARPDRTRKARRAAAVIHAETLTPSAAAALTTSAWTSGSTVMASFGEGLPRGMKQSIPPRYDHRLALSLADTRDPAGPRALSDVVGLR